MADIANDGSIPDTVASSITTNTPTMTLLNEPHDYIPIQPYWFYSRKIEDNTTWIPFSLIDVQKLEQGYTQNQEIVSTNGNRYDVNLIQRTHTPIYWLDKPNDIRRAKWYYSTPKNPRFIPLDETMDRQVENLYLETCQKQSWHKKYELNNAQEMLTFNNPNEIFYEIKSSIFEKRLLKRGLPDLFLSEIKSNEKDSIQHLCFVVHGIGDACDMKFRSLIECMEDFRQTSEMILQNHFKSYIENDQIHRIEFLPIYWHANLHLDSTGVDNHFLRITLPSVMKLRKFINRTLADILFYTSPIYCQRIITRCINEMNRLYELFLQRNPLFKGQISVIGHSLGSVILYDILSNQTSDAQDYDKLKFPITYFFALGSPIAMFLTIRGVTSISSDFTLPTCKGLLNIFHPYDPIAYRLEPLIDPEWNVDPVLISHHKGRKRIHLELVDRLPKRIDLKETMFGVLRNTVTSVTNFVESYTNSVLAPMDATTTEIEHTDDDEGTHVIEWENRPIGKLNQGRRIDYVLQHGPIEAINEYIFAFTSHVSYWTSEDTMLLILKEILRSDGFEPETKFETIEQMIKSNVLNCFSSNPVNKLNEFRAYISPKI